MTGHAPPSGMARAGYVPIRIPSADGGGFALVPGVTIRIWPLEDLKPGARARPVTAYAVLDTGAARSLVPLWSLQKMGIAPREESRRTLYSVSGDIGAYSARVRMEFDYGTGWIDIGAVDVVVPDTPRSGDPRFHTPFLVGRYDFFSKFDMCISESQKSVWLGRIDGRQAGEP